MQWATQYGTWSGKVSIRELCVHKKEHEFTVFYMMECGGLLQGLELIIHRVFALLVEVLVLDDSGQGYSQQSFNRLKRLIARRM